MTDIEVRVGAGSAQAFLFDLDGVVTDTARTHLRAWQRMFDEVVPDARFGPDDYRRHVDGRSRLDGIRAFLAARSLPVEDGSPGDGPTARTVQGMAARKDAMFHDELRCRPPKMFDGTRRLMTRLRAAGVPVGVVTASRNARAVLVAAGADGLVDVCVDGNDLLQRDLPGKPDPAQYRLAATMLQVPAARTVVVDDAVAGVRAGRAGGFGWVVGVDRIGQPEQLREAGADEVVADVGDLSVTLTDGGCTLCDCAPSVWRFDVPEFLPRLEGTRETLLALGNGCLCTRGCLPEQPAGRVHYPGTYLAGLFNRLHSHVGTADVPGTPSGGDREDESVVNLPNWLPFTVSAGSVDGWLGTPQAPVLHDHRALALASGVLLRDVLFADGSGRLTRLRQRRMVSMARPHLVALETTVLPVNWSGELLVRSGVDGSVRNGNVDSFAGLADRHLTDIAVAEHGSDLCVTASTTQSKVRIAVAARTRVYRDGVPSPHGRAVSVSHDGVTEEMSVAVRAGEEVVFDKLAAIVSSHDRGITEPAAAALGEVRRADRAVVWREHEAAWTQLWSRFSLRLEGGDADEASAAVNLTVFHLLQSLSPNTADLDVGVPARGLHGEGYRGHVFWDEVFVLPWLTFRLPELARSLLLYRYRRLDRARQLARELGVPGARFPWQSGSSGREETPSSFFNPLSGRWMSDESHRQYHVGLAVAYNVWQYWETTGDLGFMTAYGAEMLVEIARFWSALADYDALDDRYDVRGVMGPDEFHDGYPSRRGVGVDNGAYVTVMAAWVLGRALDVHSLLGAQHGAALWRRIGLSDEEVRRWDRVRRRLRLRFLRSGILAQFDGYELLRELDWASYRRRYGELGRLDLILDAEGDHPNGYRVSKQADVLMLLYLFSAEELTDLITGLGYDFDPADIPRTVEFYLARTTHGSTLSRVAHAWVLARTDRAGSWRMLREALQADLRDTQHGATREGVHLGAIAGTLDILQRCYTGLDVRDDAVLLHPQLPDGLDEMGFDLRYRDQWLDVRVDHDHVEVHAEAGSAGPTRLIIDGAQHRVAAGDTVRVTLARPETGRS